MHEVKLKEAKLRVAELIDEAAYGEEVVIIRSDGTAFKIVPISQIEAFPKIDTCAEPVRGHPNSKSRESI